MGGGGGGGGGGGKWIQTNQHAKKVVVDSPGPVDFPIGLVNSVLNLPDGQVKFCCEILITEEM